MSHQMSHPPSPQSSRGGPDKEGGGQVEDGSMRMAMGDGYYEERALPPPALPLPPPPTVPIVATSIGSSGVRDARGVMGDDAEAAAPASWTIPLATAVPMTMTSIEYASSGLAQARCNVCGRRRRWRHGRRRRDERRASRLVGQEDEARHDMSRGGIVGGGGRDNRGGGFSSSSSSPSRPDRRHFLCEYTKPLNRLVVFSSEQYDEFDVSRSPSSYFIG
jgi:hypothetical protein